jgi:hypothetical protein
VRVLPRIHTSIRYATEESPPGDDFVGFLGLDASVGVGIELVVFIDASGIEIKDPSDGLYQGGSAS